MKLTTSSKLALLSALLIVTGCDTLREQIAPPRAPDEFSVMRRAPLERPPESYEDVAQLPLPVIGMARPQELAPIKEAEKALMGEVVEQVPGQDSGAAINELLSKAGADNADPTIRYTIEAEHQSLQKKEQATFGRLIGKMTNKSPAANVVDAKAEFERLQKNRAEGKLVTDGETPTVKYE
jgi:hypothetical protein|tara:strand:+ start:145239 stop:145781 length:543 start_codon:yes stop_codon:yes gene_type:complete